MEIILLQDVHNLGLKNDIVSVKNGYGRNCLIPKKMGILCTQSARKVLAENLKQKAHKDAKFIEQANITKQKIEEIKLKIFAKSSSQGKLFGSISNIDLVEALLKFGVIVDKKYIKLPNNNIKQTGKYNAKFRLHNQVIFDVEFEIIKE